MEQIFFIRAYSACTIEVHVTGEMQEQMQLKDDIKAVKKWNIQRKSTTWTFKLCRTDVCVLESSSFKTTGYLFPL